MPMLLQVPLVDQRTQPGTDGRAPEDGNMDCVPASLSAMVQALTGRVQNADAWHDTVYGQGYIGMQDPARYAAYAATQGVSMRYAGSPSPAALVDRAYAEITAGHGVLLAIPSDWDRAPEPISANAHMVAGCDVNPFADGTITAMNPWGVAANGYTQAGYQTEHRTWWADRMARCSYQGIWILESILEANTMAGIPVGWHDDGTILSAPNGHRVILGFRQHVMAAPTWPDALVPLGEERAVTGGSRQDFALALSYDQASNTIAQVPGADWPGQLAALQARVADLQAQLASAQADQADPKAAAALAALQQFKAALAALS